MIRLNHVSKIYGDGSKKAVDDLSWDIEDGKITGFIGPNGAGKTTLFNMITGVYKPTEGDILLYGKSIAGKLPYQIAREGIARTFQNIRLFGDLSVYECTYRLSEKHVL